MKKYDVVISGSMSFKDDWLKVANQLTAKNIKVTCPLLNESNINWGLASDDEIAEKKNELNREHIEKIKNSSALLVFNGKKNGIDGYVGANTFMEMAIAFALEIPIYIYNPLPVQPNRDELLGLKPIVINSDLSKIKVNK